MPLVVVGVLLVLGCALAFTDASLHLGSHEEVLVVARPVAAGQVLSGADLRVARVSTGGGLDPVLAGAESTVLGRRAAVPLVPGELVVPGDIGSSPPVGARSDVVAVGLKAGAFPPQMAPGARVEVVPVTSSTSGAGSSPSSGAPVEATVLAVDAGASGSDTLTVFSLQVAKHDAGEVASLAAAGEVSLVELGTGS